MPGSKVILNNVVIHTKHIATTFEMTDVTHFELNTFSFNSDTTFGAYGKSLLYFIYYYNNYY